MLRKNESPATHLLIAMLVRYPEVSALRFDPVAKTLVFSYFIKGGISQTEQAVCKDQLSMYFTVAGEVDRKFPSMGALSFTPMEDLTLVTYKQDLHLVHNGEVRLVNEVLNLSFPQKVANESFQLDEENEAFQEELIDRLLVQREGFLDEKQVVAYRDGGKVFVYNT